MWGYGFGWGGMFLMLLGTLLFLALLAVLVWAVLRFVTGKTMTPVPPYRSSEPPSPSALEILRQRYARSEIDAVTYVFASFVLLQCSRALVPTPSRTAPAM